jgi:putative mRNA 3-end processing factor
LNQVVEGTGAEKVIVTHGYTTIFSKWLQEKGLDARTEQTAYEGELADIGEGSVDEKMEQE